MGKMPTINTRTEQIIRFAGFLVPLILFIYGILCQVGFIHDKNFVIGPAFYSISIVWIVMSTYQFLTGLHGRNRLLFILSMYHVLALGFIVFVAGFSTPFACAWLLLTIASYIYFGSEGFNLSMLTLFAACLFYVLFHLIDVNAIINTGIYFILVLVVGFIACTIYEGQRIDQHELLRSQREEKIQRDQLLTIVNNLTDAVITTDRDGVIKLYNAAVLDLLNTNTELAGQTIDHIVSLSDEENKPFKLLRHFRTTRSVQTRDDLRATISGETIRLNVIFSPIHETSSRTDTPDDIAGFIIMLRDITKQKSLDEEKDEFISVVSHELRTPITIAEGSLSNLSLMMERDMPKKALQDSIETSHEQVVFLASMVNDLSTLSRAERGIADAPELLVVKDLMHELYNEYAPKAQAKKLVFNLDVDPNAGYIFASKLYVQELLQNFVTNAIKYTKKGEITASAHHDNGAIKFAISDTGVGITKSDQQHVYERFWRSEDYRTRETSGTGLGLYVSQKLSRKLGTTIELKSRLNHGSTFSFELPEKKETS